MTLLLQAIGWPVVALVTKNRLIDHGWGITRTLVWLSLSLIIWFPANLKLPVNTTPMIWILMSFGLTGSCYLVYRFLEPLAAALKSSWPFILIEESLFALGLFGLSIVRGFNPAILDLEKFMDNGFMASYLKSSTLPAPDMWLAGSTINYYSFGHFLGSIMSRIWLIPLRFSYNLLLGLIMGLIFMISFSIVINLLAPFIKEKTSRLPLYIGGLIGSFLVTVGGNTHTIWYLLKHGNWQGYWYADATRFIERTIHEFPSYSFVVSDLHAHVWGLPFVLTFLVIVILWVRSLWQKRPTLRNYGLIAIILGVFLGTFIMASTWDFMIYGLFLGILGLVVIITKPQSILPIIFSALIAGITAVVVALPWALHFTSISQGIQLATEHSPIWQLLALWTGHFILSALALAVALVVLNKAARDPSVRRMAYPAVIVIALVFTAWLLLLLPELIFFKDIYTGHPRANTMFKLTYQAFVMMGLTGGWVVGMAFIRGYLHRFFRFSVLITSLLIFSCVMLFPYFSYRDYYGALKTFKGLDGWAWLKEQYPDDYNAVEWLEKNVKGQPHILEAWGESYTTFDRVSAYTGLPTVIGWRVHEWLWRGGFDIAGKRSGEVDTIYRKPLSAEALSFLNQYQVHYIIVGDKEREAYPNDLNEPDLLKLGPVVFSSGDTKIIQYTPQAVSYSAN
jgi:uncharacterized membrane protein